MQTVCAYIVSYNRPKLLPEAVSALLRQTRPPDEIIVVDNASNAETQKVLDALQSQVTLVRLPENVGGAGGFSFATRHFLRSSHRHALLLDDDCLALPTCLAELLRAAEQHDLAVSNALVLRQGDENWIGVGLWPLDPSSAPFVEPLFEVEAARRAATDGVVRGTLHPFNGTLVRRDVVEALGFVDARLFIWGDEDDFVNRVVAAGLRIGTVTTAEMSHPADTKRWQAIVPGFRFYFPTERFATIYFRNLGYTKRFRGLRWHARQLVRILLAYGAKREVMLGLSCALYYIDGVRNDYTRAPSGQRNERIVIAAAEALGLEPSPAFAIRTAAVDGV